jgi:hypothetical protein
MIDEETPALPSGLGFDARSCSSAEVENSNHP